MTNTSTLAAASQNCYFNGKPKHPRSKCPSRDQTCSYCKKVGHCAKVCQSKSTKKKSSTASTYFLGTSTTSNVFGLSKTIVECTINGHKAL